MLAEIKVATARLYVNVTAAVVVHQRQPTTTTVVRDNVCNEKVSCGSLAQYEHSLDRARVQGIHAKYGVLPAW